MPKILKTEYDSSDKSASVKIKFNNTMTLWFDVWHDDDGEITGDWNKYIFTVGDKHDDAIKAFQDANNDKTGAYNFATAIELATEALELAENTPN